MIKTAWQALLCFLGVREDIVILRSSLRLDKTVESIWHLDDERLAVQMQRRSQGGKYDRSVESGQRKRMDRRLTYTYEDS